MTADIYQRIYTADQLSASGIPAVLPSEPLSTESGYIIVNESADTDSATSLFSKYHIPPSKRQSYQLAEALFDNYDFLSSIPDIITTDEQAEIDQLLAHVVDTQPMHLARTYIESRSARVFSDPSWYALVKETWFRPFQISSSPTRSGFEHVFMGEGKPDSTNIGGLHWWYYYVTKMSSITYKGALYTNLSDGLAIPDIATMSFSWTVNGKTLTKPIGGFFVGLSVEGLMAMGMVASARDFEPPRVAVIEGFEVELKVFKSPDGRSVNTFYPIFRRVLVAPSPPGPAPGPTPALPPVEPPTVGSAAKELVRIIAAVANPAGSDEGREKVTLLNISAASVSLKGWRVIGPNRSSVVFGNVEVEGGEARTFVISARGSLQLSNKGGQVTLVDANERTVQTISYSPELARVQGAVLVWDMDSAFRQILA